MSKSGLIRVIVSLMLLTSGVVAQPFPDPWPGQKKVLAIGESSTTYQHDSISHALATIERLGRENGVYMTIIRTDTQLVTKGTVMNGDEPVLNAKNLDYFDAIFFFGAGPGTLSPEQMEDLLSFVRDDGKGFVAAHSGDNAFLQYPEYVEMIGGRWDHPWTKSEQLEI